MEREEEMYIEKEVHLRDYFRILRKRKYTIYTFFAIVVALVVLHAFTSIPQYTAVSKMMIEEGEKTPLLTSYGYVQYNPEFLQTQVQIIKSTPVAKKVVHTLNLEETYDSYFKDLEGRITFGSMAKGIAGWGKDLYATAFKLIGVVQADYIPGKSETPAETLPKDEQIAMAIAGQIAIQPVRDSRILDISFTSSNPVLARQIVNSVVKAYIEKTLEMKMESSGYTIKWMTQKADEERARLRQSENALQEYMKTQNIVTTENRLAITPQKMSEINTQMTHAETRRKELEAVYEKVRVLKDNYDAAESIQKISSDPTVTAIRARILEAEKQIMDFSKKYGPRHPMMKTAAAELEMLQQKRKHEIQRVTAVIKNEYELARSTEQDLGELLAKTKAEAIGLNEKLIQYNLLKQEVDTNRQLYEALVTKLKEQAVSEQAQSVKVWVVEEAKTPDAPSKPRKNRNILLGIILGLFGGHRGGLLPGVPGQHRQVPRRHPGAIRPAGAQRRAPAQGLQERPGARRHGRPDGDFRRKLQIHPDRRHALRGRGRSQEASGHQHVPGGGQDHQRRQPGGGIRPGGQADALGGCGHAQAPPPQDLRPCQRKGAQHLPGRGS